jgi:hypothetical protein
MAQAITIQNSNMPVRAEQLGRRLEWNSGIIGGSGNNIYDSYIHVENRALTNSFSSTASHAGIQGKGAANVTIQGNVVCYGSANFRADLWKHCPDQDDVVNGTVDLCTFTWDSNQNQAANRTSNLSCNNGTLSGAVC